MTAMKRTFSIILAVFMLVSALPFTASAADPIALTVSNVTEWPVATPKNGVVYYGEKVGDALDLVGGKVEYNGVTVSGHFEFIDPTAIPTSFGSNRANIKFVPDDESTYIGFEKKRCGDVKFDVTKTTPVYADEANDPVVATKVEAGSKLSSSVLSGGKMINPYNPDEPKVLAQTWYWVDETVIVNESGYYEASFSVGNYNQVFAQVYVGIIVDIIESEISIIPSVPALIYDGVTTWNDITLSGGLAVEKGTSKAIEGTFSIAESWKVKVINAGTYEIDVTFTPNDTESYTKVDFKIPVTVNKAPIRFVDENGNDIVPEITVTYGTKFNDISRLLNPYVKGADYTYFVMGDLSSKVCEEGTYTVKATAPSDGAHYEDTDLTFKIVIEKKKLNPKLYSTTGKLYIYDNSGVYHPTGTFTLEYTIDGVEQTPIEGIKYHEHFDWNPTKSGNYRYEIVYVEATENEHYIIDDFSTTNTVTLSWNMSATGAVDSTQAYGTQQTVTAPATDPEKADKPFYGFTGWTDVNGNTGLTEEELKAAEITFAMPDGDVDLDATYAFSFLMLLEYVYTTVVNFFASVVNSLATLF